MNFFLHNKYKSRLEIECLALKIIREGIFRKANHFNKRYFHNLPLILYHFKLEQPNRAGKTTFIMGMMYVIVSMERTFRDVSEINLSRSWNLWNFGVMISSIQCKKCTNKGSLWSLNEQRRMLLSKCKTYIYYQRKQSLAELGQSPYTCLMR